jgi:ribonuclease Z
MSSTLSEPITIKPHDIVLDFAATHSSQPITVESIVFLGTASAIPTTKRNTSSLAYVLSSGSSFLLDCGEGTQTQILRSECPVYLSRVDAILITHLHGDHCYGIFGLLLTIAAQGRTAPLTIICPMGLKEMLQVIYKHTAYLHAYEVHMLELDMTTDSMQDCGIIGNALRVYATRIPHTEHMHAFAYTVKEQDKSGAFLLSKTQAILGGGTLMSGKVGGERINKLKMGENVTLPDGRVLRSIDCIEPVQMGAKISLVQDTYDASVAIDQLQNSDLLIHEATYASADEVKAREHGHSTAGQAGKYAATIHAGMLILTHVSARYAPGILNTAAYGDQDHGPEQKLQELSLITGDTLVRDAQNSLNDTIPVHCAEDLLVFQRRSRQKQQNSKHGALFDCRFALNR